MKPLKNTLFTSVLYILLSSVLSALNSTANPIDMDEGRSLNLTGTLTHPPYDASSAIDLYPANPPILTAGEDWKPGHPPVSTNTTMPTDAKPWEHPDWADPYGYISEGYFSIVICLVCTGPRVKDPDKWDCFGRVPWAVLYGQDRGGQIYYGYCPREGRRWDNLHSWLPWSLSIHFDKSNQCAYMHSKADNMWIKYADQYADVSSWQQLPSVSGRQQYWKWWLILRIGSDG
jgi:hypothetical protein